MYCRVHCYVSSVCLGVRDFHITFHVAKTKEAIHRVFAGLVRIKNVMASVKIWLVFV